MTRFRHRDGSLLHVAYCTNVHPAEDLDGVICQLRRYAAPLRARLRSDRLGVGLWLAAPLAGQLRAHADDLARLRGELEQLGLEVVTLNGFPYEAFHAPVVKRAVYRPDWTTPARAAYTLDLAHVLAALLPTDVSEGSISTLPFGWREGWGTDQTSVARGALAEIARELTQLEQSSGASIRIAIEPEPGCAIETTEQAIAALDGIDPVHIGVCLDACHMAVQFEDATETARSLALAGVPVVKAQVSAALRSEHADPAELERFVEPRFLHQTRTLAREDAQAPVAQSAPFPTRRCAQTQSRQRALGVDDLPEALAGGLPRGQEWRVHFHVPIHLDGGRTTQPQLRETLSALLCGPRPLTRHLELETYTWDVMPGELRSDREDETLIEGLALELQWLCHELERLGLERMR